MVRKLGTLVNKESEFIHSPFHGEIIQGREAITIKAKFEDKDWQEVPLWSYSPFGVEFINNGFSLKQGDSISIRTKLAGDENEFNGLVVNSIHEQDGTKLVGVRTFIKDKLDPQEYSGAERRSHRRWSCSEDFLPTGTAPNPVRYNDYILFRVEDISSGGLKIITSMRNKFLGIGQCLECTLSLPYVGIVRAGVKVKHVNTVFYRDKEFLIMGAEFIKTDSILLRSLGDYLLNFAKEVTVKSLNKEGFNIKNVSKWVDFSYVKTEEEYQEVLDLRLRAYKSAGKVPKDASKESMANDLDSRSKILITKHNGKIIGTIVYVIPEKEEDILICQHFPYPKSLPKISEIGCSWRFCIDKDFRHADITHKIIAYVVYNFIKNGRRYWFSGAEKDLLPIYDKYGLKTQGIVCNDFGLKSKEDDGRENELIIMDTHKIIKGQNISPKYWNLLYRDLFDYLLETNEITLTPVDKLRIWFYKSIGDILVYGGR